MSGFSDAATELVTLGLTDGQEVRGYLARFTPTSPQWLFHRVGHDGEEVIPRERVAYVGFHRLPGQTTSPNRPGMVPVRVHTQTGLEFLILTQLGTHGSLWFHGYPIDPDSPFQRIFFFRHGVRHKERLEPLGEILVEEGVVKADAVEQAVATQQSERSTPLGAILIEQRKVDAQQIEQAVAIQARKRMKLGEVLIAEGLAERADIEAALAEQQRRRGRKLGDILIERGVVDEAHLLAALGVKFDLPFVDLDDYPVQSGAFAAIPLPIQRRYGIVPIARDTRSLTIAISDPLTTEVVDIVRAMVDQEVREVLATKVQIQALIERGGETLPVVEGGDTVAVRLRSVLEEALRRKAEAIYLLPGSEGLRIACRMSGGWQHLERIERGQQGQAMTALLAWAAMERLDPGRPQEGVLPLEEAGVTLRVSMLPGPLGPSVVLEPLPAATLRSLQELGWSSVEVEQVEGWLRRGGLIVATGPSGSGRSTVLEAMLGVVAEAAGHPLLLIDTLKAPAEGVDVWRVDADIQPAKALQSALRHAPDLLALDLPLDAATAALAVTAAVGGLPVLLRLEASSAVAAVERLRALGIPSAQIAAALHGVVAVRLVDRLCPECRIEVAQADESRRLLAGQGYPEEIPLFRRGTGCPVCAEQGVAGKVLIREVLVAGIEMARAIGVELGGDDLEGLAVEGGMVRLSAAAVALAGQGVIGVEALHCLPWSPS